MIALTLAIAVVVVGILDAISTLRGLDAGLSEKNPIMRRVLDAIGAGGFVLAKAVLHGGAAVVVWWAQHWAITAAAAVMVAVYVAFVLRRNRRLIERTLAE